MLRFELTESAVKLANQSDFLDTVADHKHTSGTVAEATQKEGVRERAGPDRIDIL